MPSRPATEYADISFFAIIRSSTPNSMSVSNSVFYGDDMKNDFGSFTTKSGFGEKNTDLYWSFRLRASTVC